MRKNVSLRLKLHRETLSNLTSDQIGGRAGWRQLVRSHLWLSGADRWLPHQGAKLHRALLIGPPHPPSWYASSIPKAGALFRRSRPERSTS